MQRRFFRLWIAITLLVSMIAILITCTNVTSRKEDSLEKQIHDLETRVNELTRKPMKLNVTVTPSITQEVKYVPMTTLPTWARTKGEK